MKLYCSVSVINRVLSTLSIKSEKRCKNATLTIIKRPKDDAFIVLITPNNKSGTRYKLQDNIEKTFSQFIKEGKVTIRFKEPPHDICITADPLALRNFMVIMKKVWSGEEVNEIPTILNKKSVQKVSTKMDINNKTDYPVLQGFSSALTVLNIVDCHIKKLDLRITKLKNLTSLVISKNNLVELPTELGNLTLKYLSLSHNKLIDKYDNWLFLSGPIRKTLEHLDLSFNKLESLPNSLSKLLALKTIKIKGNTLKQIPFLLCLLPQLQHVDVSHNKLTSLPGTIMRPKLYKLDTLDISDNEELRESPYGRIPNIPVCSVSSLLEYSANTIIRNRLEYNEESIPRTLVRCLDQGKMCYCGRFRLKSCGETYAPTEAKTLANTFISTNLISIISLNYSACCPEHCVTVS